MFVRPKTSIYDLSCVTLLDLEYNLQLVWFDGSKFKVRALRWFGWECVSLVSGDEWNVLPGKRGNTIRGCPGTPSPFRETPEFLVFGDSKLHL